MKTRFIESEATGGVVLMLAAAIALAVANSPLAASYHALCQSVGAIIDDGLMAIFFLLVGLEIKRELLRGELAGARKAALPALAALGGMVVPAAIYAARTAGTPFIRGWGIPMATDIAFTVGVLALLGRRAAPSLTVFLTALAIVDDLGAVVIIAIFYAGGVQLGWLAAAALVVAALVALNRFGVRHLAAYLAGGALLWYAVFQSGVHATIAGVLLGMTIPADATDDAGSPLERLEHTLERPVAFGVLPLFALANAGVTIPWHSLGTALGHPITVGVFLGLLAGKTIGVFGAATLARRFGLGELPGGASTRQMLGGATLAGIGFTMSIFIATLAFRDRALLDYAKIGIVAGSITSGLAGAAILLARRPT
ncbi:MAG: Na+/H+ antiporter NhaA [Myxococcales bacterium]|nr:Na+/H+ antiporter NhaA [Myxococcales bacterium]